MSQTLIRTLVFALIILVSSSTLYTFNPLLFKPAFAIPPDQTTVVLSTWVIHRNKSADTFSAISDFAGDVYFVAANASKIGRLIPLTSTFTEWTLPSASSRPGLHGIAFDPASGNVYFAETNKIGRLIPLNSTITEWTLPGNSYNVFRITAGFDGIYLASANTNKIGRLVPLTSTFTEWTLPSSFGKPNGIAFDPSSGNVYFAETNASKIGRLIPLTSTFTQWVIGSSPLVITVSPAGGCFFVDNIGRVGRLS
jgi:streptogramin lyase